MTVTIWRCLTKLDMCHHAKNPNPFYTAELPFCGAEVFWLQDKEGRALLLSCQRCLWCVKAAQHWRLPKLLPVVPHRGNAPDHTLSIGHLWQSLGCLGQEAWQLWKDPEWAHWVSTVIQWVLTWHFSKTSTAFHSQPNGQRLSVFVPICGSRSLAASSAACFPELGSLWWSPERCQHRDGWWFWWIPQLPISVPERSQSYMCVFICSI